MYSNYLPHKLKDEFQENDGKNSINFISIALTVFKILSQNIIWSLYQLCEKDRGDIQLQSLNYKVLTTSWPLTIAIKWWPIQLSPRLKGFLGYRIFSAKTKSHKQARMVGHPAKIKTVMTLSSKSSLFIVMIPKLQIFKKWSSPKLNYLPKANS